LLSCNLMLAPVSALPAKDASPVEVAPTSKSAYEEILRVENFFSPRRSGLLAPRASASACGAVSPSPSSTRTA
jgi:hypothetical protein